MGIKGSKALQNGTKEKIYDRITILYVKEWKIMRIISQSGLLDVPYELIAISPYSGNMATIIGTFPGNDLGKGDRVYILAEYSTEEKAIKAMEMCREKYLSRMELDGGYDIVNKCYVQPNYWVLPKVFQFPKDEEV